MTLAGRVGTGNIAGVATAITFGGPGHCSGCGWLRFWGQFGFCRVDIGSGL
ncbi:alanine:cation symporter family protein [Serratia ureilytica]